LVDRRMDLDLFSAGLAEDRASVGGTKLLRNLEQS